MWNEGPDLGAELYIGCVPVSLASGRAASLDGCSVLCYTVASEHSGILLGASFQRPEGINKLIK